MKYIKREEFIAFNGKPLQTKKGVNDTIANIFFEIGSQYFPSQELLISCLEMERFNNMMIYLEDEKEKSEYLAFEDSDFKLLKKILSSLILRCTRIDIINKKQISFTRNAPVIEKIFGGALSEIPIKKISKKVIND